MRRWTICAVCLACAWTAFGIGANPRYIEEAAIGGGYGDASVNNPGGIWMEAEGDLLMDGSLTVDTNVSIGGTLGVTGAITLSGDTKIIDDKFLILGTDSDFKFGYDELTDNRLELVDGSGNLMGHITDAGTTGNWQLTGTLEVTGAATLSSTLGVTGVTTHSNDAKVIDDKFLVLGTDSDFKVAYDELTDNRLEITDSGGNLMLHLTDAGTTGNATITGALAIGGALSGVTTLSMGGALSGVTTLSMGGALSGVTTLSASGVITSTLATGTAPFTIASTTKVSNLNVDSLEGTDWTAPGAIGGVTPGSGAFTTLSASGVITSTLATGTAPFTIASTTKVSNLNVDSLEGGDWAIPGTIGSTTPNTGAFTTLSASGAATLSSTLDVAGNVALGNNATPSATSVLLMKHEPTDTAGNPLLYLDVQLRPSPAGASTASQYAIRGQTWLITANATSGELIGVSGEIDSPYLAGGGAGNAYCLQARIRNSGAGAAGIGNIIGLYVTAGGSGSTYPNYYGVLIQANTGSTIGGTTKVGLDIGSISGASGTNLAIRTGAGGDVQFGADLFLNGNDLKTTTAGTFNLVNDTATTVNFAGGATTALNMGALTGTTAPVNLGGSDTCPALVSLYGGGTGEAGASVRFYNDDDGDATVNYWELGNYTTGSGDFMLKTAGGTNVFTVSDATAITTYGTQIIGRTGGTGANTAPIKLVAGTNNTTPEEGAIEFDGTLLTYVDTGANDTRQTVVPEAYCDIYENLGATAITTEPDATYVGWVNATANQSSIDTFSNNATADRIAIGTDGDGAYLVTIRASFIATALTDVIWCVHKNGVADNSIKFISTIGASGTDVVSGSASGIMNLAALDYIDVRVSNDDAGATTCTPQTVNFSAVRIGR